MTRLIAALTVAATVAASANSCGQSTGSRASTATTKAKAAPVARADAATNPDGPNDCKVIVQEPKVVNHSVTSYAYVKCAETPDLYQFTAFLDVGGNPRDSCHQSFSWTYGEHCDLVAKCEPGEWSVPFTLDVGLPGFDPSEKVDQGTTTKEVTQAECDA